MTTPSDLRSIPPDLPVPVDDRAADHLRDRSVPAICLPATTGRDIDLANAARGTLVLYVYPRTGIPGEMALLIAVKRAEPRHQTVPHGGIVS